MTDAAGGGRRREQTHANLRHRSCPGAGADPAAPARAAPAAGAGAGVAAWPRARPPPRAGADPAAPAGAPGAVPGRAPRTAGPGGEWHGRRLPVNRPTESNRKREAPAGKLTGAFCCRLFDLLRHPTRLPSPRPPSRADLDLLLLGHVDLGHQHRQRKPPHRGQGLDGGQVAPVAAAQLPAPTRPEEDRPAGSRRVAPGDRAEGARVGGDVRLPEASAAYLASSNPKGYNRLGFVGGSQKDGHRSGSYGESLPRAPGGNAPDG